MGRSSKDSFQIQSETRIELSFLLKNGYFKKGKLITGRLHWNYKNEPIGSINIICSYFENEIWLRLMYKFTDISTGEKKDYDYKIYLQAIPSNLGKGEVLYFVCPVSGKRCRILFRIYGSPIWKCREAHQYPLYYPLQKCSKYSRYNLRFYRTEEILKNLTTERRTYQYKGKPTKRSRRIMLLRRKHYYLDIKRYSPENFPKRLRTLLQYGTN